MQQSELSKLINDRALVIKPADKRVGCAAAIVSTTHILI